MNSPLNIPELPHLYHLSDLTIIQISGPDAETYLQGQLTCDVTTLQVGQWTPGAHCTPKGKVLAIFRLLRISDDTYFMLYKQGIETNQLPALKKYAVFSKVSISDVSAEFHRYGLAGQHVDAIHSVTLPEHDAYVLPITTSRSLILARNTLESPLPLVEHAMDWWGFDILDGIANLSATHQDTHIPQAFNLQAFEFAISFKKGCYTGQEIVARAKYRGSNNRTLFILQGSASKIIATQSQLELKLADQWKPIGDIIDVWQQQDQFIASVILNNSTSPDAQFRIADDASSIAGIRPLPYTLE